MNDEIEVKIQDSFLFGVRAIIPIELGIDIEFSHVQWEDKMGLEGRDGFKVYRFVVDYSFIDANVIHLDQPVKLQVYFTHEDLNHVESLQLRKWTGDEWKEFDDPKQIYFPKGYIWAGFFEVSIDNTTDPPIALGE